MTPYITEILAEISANPELLLTKFKDQYAIKSVLEYAFDKQKKFILPEGEPPYKKDEAPLGMSPANFYQQVKKFYIFQRTDISNIRREQLFIQFLEGIHPDEAKVVIAVKDQNLTSLYPGITADLVVKAGLVKEENVFRQSVLQGKKDTKGTKLVLNITDIAETKDTIGGKTPTEATKRPRGRPKKVQE